MRKIRSAAKLALGVAVGLALMLSSTLAPASAATTAATKASTAKASATSTWTLLNIYSTPVCVTTSGHRGFYFLFVVVGTWSTTLRGGMRNLPPGTTDMGALLPPGSNHGSLETGVRVNGWIGAPIAPAPAGVYNAEIWVTDGTATQTIPVPIHIKERC